jgi:hypothetical protein
VKIQFVDITYGGLTIIPSYRRQEHTGCLNVIFQQTIAYDKRGSVEGHEMVAYSKVQRSNSEYCFIVNCSVELYKLNSENRKGE